MSKAVRMLGLRREEFCSKFIWILGKAAVFPRLGVWKGPPVRPNGVPKKNPFSLHSGGQCGLRAS